MGNGIEASLVLLRNPEETADADENPPVDGAGILGLALGGGETSEDGTADEVGPVTMLEITENGTELAVELPSEVPMVDDDSSEIEAGDDESGTVELC